MWHGHGFSGGSMEMCFPPATLASCALMSRTEAFACVALAIRLRMSHEDLVLFVKTPEDTVIAITVNKNTTVGYVKAVIEDGLDIPMTKQRLAYAGKGLHDSESLAENNILSESSLYVEWVE